MISMARISQQIRCYSKMCLLEKSEYIPVIGLEVHVQLCTSSKLFSRAATSDVTGPNSRVCGFDVAIPGTMPRLNRSAVMHALRLAYLLNCQVPNECRFDRKHYFYADMPSGYQITQSAFPIAMNGNFGFHVYAEGIRPFWKEVGILQLQLEQDSGKTIHHLNTSLIDLNRAGTALVEVVTTPSFTTALEALCFVQQLRLILMHYGICQGEMHNGNLRVDANVSLSHNGNTGVRTEVKNMNSLRHLHTAINYEIDRQFGILSNGGNVINETRACDSIGRTVPMRDKEEETDYRFIPEPNLPTLHIRDSWIADIRKEFDRTKKPLFQQFVDLGFSAREAIYFEEQPLIAHFISNCSHGFSFGVTCEQFVRWLKELKLLMQRSKLTFPPQGLFFAEQFMKLITYCESGKITKLRAVDCLRKYANGAESNDIDRVLTENDLWKLTDEDTIKSIILQVIQENESLSIKAKNGNSKALTRLRNIIIDKSRKRIDVELAENAIRMLL